MAVRNKVNGVWTRTHSMYAKVNGGWRDILGVWVKEGGVWKHTFVGNFAAWFEHVDVNTIYISGSHKIQDMGTHLLAEAVGHTGGEAYPAQIGWTFKNLPADKSVTITFEVKKHSYPENDVDVWTNSGEHVAYSDSTGEITRTFSNHGGRISMYINFFPTSAHSTTTYIKIFKVMVGDDQIYPER